MAGRYPYLLKGLDWRQQPAPIAEVDPDDETDFSTRHGRVLYDRDGHEGFCFKLSKLCSCRKSLWIYVTPVSSVTFAVEVQTEPRHKHKEEKNESLPTIELATMLEDPFRVMDYYFTCNCPVCGRCWDWRIWPFRPHFLQYKAKEVRGRRTNMPNPQTWHFPTQVQWAMWLAHPESFSFNDGTDGSIESSKMIEPLMKPGRVSDCWARQCDDWAQLRLDLLDAPKAMKKQWKAAFFRGSITLKSNGVLTRTSEHRNPSKSQSSHQTSSTWAKRLRRHDWRSPPETSYVELLPRSPSYDDDDYQPRKRSYSTAQLSVEPPIARKRTRYLLANGTEKSSDSSCASGTSDEEDKNDEKDEDDDDEDQDDEDEGDEHENDEVEDEDDEDEDEDDEDEDEDDEDEDEDDEDEDEDDEDEDEVDDEDEDDEDEDDEDEDDEDEVDDEDHEDNNEDQAKKQGEDSDTEEDEEQKKMMSKMMSKMMRKMMRKMVDR